MLRSERYSYPSWPTLCGANLMAACIAYIDPRQLIFPVISGSVTLIYFIKAMFDLRFHVTRVSKERRLAAPCAVSFNGVRRSLRRLAGVLLGLSLVLAGGQQLIFRQMAGRSVSDLPVSLGFFAWVPNPPQDYRDLKPGLYTLCEATTGKPIQLDVSDRHSVESAGAIIDGWIGYPDEAGRAVRPVGGCEPFLDGKIIGEPVGKLQAWLIEQSTEAVLDKPPFPLVFPEVRVESLLFWLGVYHSTRILYSDHRGWWIVALLAALSCASWAISSLPADAIKYLAASDEELAELKEAKS